MILPSTSSNIHWLWATRHILSINIDRYVSMFSDYAHEIIHILAPRCMHLYGTLWILNVYRSILYSHGNHSKYPTPFLEDFPTITWIGNLTLVAKFKVTIIFPTLLIRLLYHAKYLTNYGIPPFLPFFR